MAVAPLKSSIEKRLLVSSLFALEENNPIVPNIPNDHARIVKEIKLLNERHNYLNFLTSIRVATKFEEDAQSYRNNDYCVLSLNYDTNQLTVKRFKVSDIDSANQYYIDKENTQSPNTDTVLVRVSSFYALKAAYPNYFSDISEFVCKTKEYIM